MPAFNEEEAAWRISVSRQTRSSWGIDRDIVAYSKGEEPPRDNNAFSRKHPLATAWIKFAVSAAAGAIAGIVLVQLLAGS